MRIFLPALGLGMGLCLGLPALAQDRTISVAGDGVVQVVPDMATLDLGVMTSGDTAAAAMAANNEALAAVVGRLVSAKVADRDMQTSNLTLYPNWVMTPDGSGQEVQGYVAQNQLRVNIRDLASVGAVLDAAIQDGANTLNGLTFGLADDQDERNEARKAAVADAKARAQVLADAAGVKLGEIVAISEGYGEVGPAPMFRAEAASATPIATGELGVTSNVTVTWALAE